MVTGYEEQFYNDIATIAKNIRKMARDIARIADAVERESPPQPEPSRP
jgi:hypothetical protein